MLSQMKRGEGAFSQFSDFAKSLSRKKGGRSFFPQFLRRPQGKEIIGRQSLAFAFFLKAKVQGRFPFISVLSGEERDPFTL